MKADQIPLFPLGSCVHILSRGLVHLCKVCLTACVFVDEVYKQFKFGSNHALCYVLCATVWHFYSFCSEIIFVITHLTTEYYFKELSDVQKLVNLKLHSL